jgi:AcrR family transcriptional regulator
MIIDDNKRTLSMETAGRYTARMTDAPTPEPLPDDTRRRIVAAASALIAEGGRDAATTRAVATAAGIQAPTLYRLFGDKRGLLDAVTEAAMAEYLAGKAQREPQADPVQDLREGWDTHVAFGLAHPGLFSIMSAEPHAGPASASVKTGLEYLRQRIRRIAQAGRLRVGEDRAVAMVQSACVGAVLTLLGTPPAQRDPGLSDAVREAVIAAITGDAVIDDTPGAAGAALALRATLDDASALSAGERLLLDEWLGRIAAAPQTPDR